MDASSGLDGGGASRDASTDAGHDAGNEVSDAGADCTATPGEVVHFTTEDGVMLEADLYVPAVRSGAGAYLFHMIPPSNDRTNYPASFITALTDRGFVVLNVDRRGAGGSDGVATEAYIGPNGKLDVLAAVTYLGQHACAPSRFVLAGASNGTTSALDYTVFAADTPTAPSPAALVFLTGGTYTEAQNMISNERATLDEIPIRFVYSTAEAAWSTGFISGASDRWVFDERAGGAHGTLMFGAVPATIPEVADWMRDQAAP